MKRLAPKLTFSKISKMRNNSKDIKTSYGQSVQISPLIRKLVAPNPSIFTFLGTNSYLIGAGESLCVIDPGPLIASHIDDLIRIAGKSAITHIFITHTHNDHSPAAQPLKEKTGAKSYGFGPHGLGRAMNSDSPPLEEGGDMNFKPDYKLHHGDVIEGDGWTMEAVFTPGHTSNHMCFALREEKALFTGDHIMGWSSSVIVPPDGHMGDYLASLRLLLERDDQIYWPAHGDEIDHPKRLVRAFLTHRAQRAASIQNCLKQGLHHIGDMVAKIYKDVDKRLHPAAAMSTLAHLLHMAENGKVLQKGKGLKAVWSLADDKMVE